MKRGFYKERQEYAVYKGEEFICMGTAREVAEKLGIKPKTVQFLSTPANIRRVESSPRKEKHKRLIAVKLNDI